jgi:REP element-mobilizing transposase RayT
VKWRKKMPRPKRIITPGCVYEIMQQGNNGVNVVKSYEDRLYLESLLIHYAHRYNIELHKVDIYPNILRLVVMPGTADGVPRFMHAVTCK